jgi:hypothetical protein
MMRALNALSMRGWYCDHEICFRRMCRESKTLAHILTAIVV